MAPIQPGRDDRGLIEKALLLVRSQRTCSDEEAEAILLETSRTTNASVAAVAGAVVRTAEEPRRSLV